MASSDTGPDRATPLIQITGRAGVGRSSLAAVLGPVPGADVAVTAGRDRPGEPDPELTGDVIVLVVLDPPRAADRAAADAAGDRLLPVLTRTDTLPDVDAALARAAAALGTACLPVSATGAGVDALRAALTARIRPLVAARAATRLARMRSATDTATRDEVEAYLASDDGVRLVADARSADVSEGADVCGTQPLERARYWRARMHAAPDPDTLRAALAVHRAAVRDWTVRG